VGVRGLKFGLLPKHDARVLFIDCQQPPTAIAHAMGSQRDIGCVAWVAAAVGGNVRTFTRFHTCASECSRWRTRLVHHFNLFRTVTSASPPSRLLVLLSANALGRPSYNRSLRGNRVPTTTSKQHKVSRTRCNIQFAFLAMGWGVSIESQPSLVSPRKFDNSSQQDWAIIPVDDAYAQQQLSIPLSHRADVRLTFNATQLLHLPLPSSTVRSWPLEATCSNCNSL
jgi:hypothetical protein